jgi:hypothetical protein
MNNQNLAQDLTKKKPEARLSDSLVQKHSSGIEHGSESSTLNKQKKARVDVRLLKISNHAESDMYLNLAHKLGKKKPDLGDQAFSAFITLGWNK